MAFGGSGGAESYASTWTVTCLTAATFVYLSAFVNCVTQEECQHIGGSIAAFREAYEVVEDLLDAPGIRNDEVNVEALQRLAPIDIELDLLLLRRSTECSHDFLDRSDEVERRRVDREQAHVEFGDIQDICESKGGQSLSSRPRGLELDLPSAIRVW